MQHRVFPIRSLRRPLRRTASALAAASAAAALSALAALPALAQDAAGTAGAAGTGGGRPLLSLSVRATIEELRLDVASGTTVTFFDGSAGGSPNRLRDACPLEPGATYRDVTVTLDAYAGLQSADAVLTCSGREVVAGTSETEGTPAASGTDGAMDGFDAQDLHAAQHAQDAAAAHAFTSPADEPPA